MGDHFVARLRSPDRSVRRMEAVPNFNKFIGDDDREQKSQF